MHYLVSFHSVVLSSPYPLSYSSMLDLTEMCNFRWIRTGLCNFRQKAGCDFRWPTARLRGWWFGRRGVSLSSRSVTPDTCRPVWSPTVDDPTPSSAASLQLEKTRLKTNITILKSITEPTRWFFLYFEWKLLNNSAELLTTGVWNWPTLRVFVRAIFCVLLCEWLQKSNISCLEDKDSLLLIDGHYLPLLSSNPHHSSFVIIVVKF